MSNTEKIIEILNQINSIGEEDVTRGEILKLVKQHFNHLSSEGKEIVTESIFNILLITLSHDNCSRF